MKPRPVHRERETPTVNVTPMIDVIMCLIVFYLIVGHLVIERKGVVDLPPTNAGEAEDSMPADLVVTIDDAGTVFVDGVESSAAGEIIAGLGARNPDAVVEVRASRQLAYGTVKPIIEACRDASLSVVRLATEQRP